MKTKLEKLAALRDYHIHMRDCTREAAMLMQIPLGTGMWLRVGEHDEYVETIQALIEEIAAVAT